MNETYPLCTTCANNDNGICKLTNKDMYENRLLPVKYGGCGEMASKHIPLFVEKHDSGEYREPYGWA
jgi:hypothetical protein